MSPTRRALIPILAAAWLVQAAPPARAAEDAGTQSVFAYGAGNRALAMGGAFVAAADDASATLWNPAGLGLAQRGEFEAVQSGDLGLGFREVYGSLVVPSWRWGAAGLVFRRFGVDGIEQRDGRNGVGATVYNGVYVAELNVRFDDGASQQVRRKVAVVR